MKKYTLLAMIALSPFVAEGSSRKTYLKTPAPAQPVVQQQVKILNWTTNYAEAVKTAQSTGKNILLFFTGSDWCGWCKKMQDEIFTSPDFKAAEDKFVFVEIDFPMKTRLPEELARQNNTLKQKYAISGFPTVVILDTSENKVLETGYQPGGGKAYLNYLLSGSTQPADSFIEE